jgi:hypothetical protein
MTFQVNTQLEAQTFSNLTVKSTIYSGNIGQVLKNFQCDNTSSLYFISGSTSYIMPLKGITIPAIINIGSFSSPAITINPDSDSSLLGNSGNIAILENFSRNGCTDIALGDQAWSYQCNGCNYGGVFVIEGQSDFPGNFIVSDMYNTNQYGFIVGGIYNGGFYPYSISTVENFSGAGNTDLVICSSIPGQFAYQCTLIYGTPYSLPNMFNQTWIDGGNGFNIIGQSHSNPVVTDFGGAVTGIIDMNGDGYGEIAVNNGLSNILIIEGGSQGSFPATITPDQIPGKFGTNIIKINPEDSVYSSFSLASGDFDNDGLGDLVVAVNVIDGRDLQMIYVVKGQKGGLGDQLILDNMTSDQGSIITGVPQECQTYYSATALNLNGDEYTDLAISSSGACSGGLYENGRIYFVLGSADGIPSGDIVEISTKYGFIVNGTEENRGLSITENLGDLFDIGRDAFALFMGQPSVAYIAYYDI